MRRESPLFFRGTGHTAPRVVFISSARPQIKFMDHIHRTLTTGPDPCQATRACSLWRMSTRLTRTMPPYCETLTLTVTVTVTVTLTLTSTRTRPLCCATLPLALILPLLLTLLLTLTITLTLTGPIALTRTLTLTPTPTPTPHNTLTRCEWIQTAMRMHHELGSSRVGLGALGL